MPLSIWTYKSIKIQDIIGFGEGDQIINVSETNLGVKNNEKFRNKLSWRLKKDFYLNTKDSFYEFGNVWTIGPLMKQNLREWVVDVTICNADKCNEENEILIEVSSTNP